MKKIVLWESSELEQAEVVLAAKSISEKLQSMAENVAKIEVNDLMPLGDTLRLAFGEQMADSFNKTTSEQLRQLLQYVSTAKVQIDNQILRFENIVNGNPDAGNDMAMNTGVDANAPPNDMQDGVDVNEPKDSAPEQGSDDGMFAPEDNADGGEPEPEQQAPLPPEGRARKESFVYLDKVILESFKRMLKEKVNPTRAVKYISERHGVELSEVVNIIKEAKSVNEAVHVSGKKSKMTRNEALKKDDGFYVEKDDGKIGDNMWHVFGDQTGFSYGHFNSKTEARTLFDELKANLKKKVNEVDKSKQTSFDSDMNVFRNKGLTPQQRTYAMACLKGGDSHDAAAKKSLKKYPNADKKTNESNDSLIAGKSLGMGNSTFGLLNVGDKFHWRDSEEIYTKHSKDSYKDSKGKIFKTGNGASVFKEKTNEKDNHWIEKATTKNPGKFAAKAKAAGETTAEYADEKENAKGVLGKEARLAKTLSKERKKVNESFAIGDEVKTTMGVKRTGKVIKPFDYKKATDGTYREPYAKDKVVYVEWDDGTKGWSHEIHLEKTKKKEYDGSTPMPTFAERKKAFSQDFGFVYKQSEDGIWGCYGQQTGYCYATGTEDEAKLVADKLFDIKKHPEENMEMPANIQKESVKNKRGIKLDK
jgi:hypothetical protein